jgi:Domain of unknown function (DUF6285)
MRIEPDAKTLLTLADESHANPDATHYERLMAAHARQTALRELELGQDHDRATLAEMRHLGAADAAVLAAMIRRGDFDTRESRTSLWTVLMAATLRSLAESNPDAL